MTGTKTSSEVVVQVEQCALFADEFRIDHVFNRTVVYFLFRDNKLTYIGRTDSLLGRLDRHASRDLDASYDRGHRFDRVLFVEVDPKDALAAEGAFVRYLLPPENRRMPYPDTSRDSEILARYGLCRAANGEK